MGIARGQGQSGKERTTPPTSWSVGRVVQHSNHRKPAFSLSWRPIGTRLPAKGLVTIFPFESRSKNRSAQLARLTTNLPLCSRKTPRRGSVPIYGASRAIAGRSCPGPRRIEGYRRSPSPAASPKLFEARRENAFFFGIDSSWTKIIDMRGVSFGKLDFEKTDLGKQETSLGRPPSSPFPDSHIDDFCPRCGVFSKEGRTCRISPR